MVGTIFIGLITISRMFCFIHKKQFILTYFFYYFLTCLLFILFFVSNIFNVHLGYFAGPQLYNYKNTISMLVHVNKIHRYKAELKNIKAKERIFWRKSKEITGGMMINTFLNNDSRSEGVLHDLCKFHTACTESKGFYNLVDS